MSNRLSLIGIEEPAEIPTTAVQQATEQREKAALAGLMIALKALSQRFVVAAASLVDLALFAAVFAVWWQIIGGPSQLQIVAASLFSIFGVGVIWMRRRA